MASCSIGNRRVCTGPIPGGGACLLCLRAQLRDRFKAGEMSWRDFTDALAELEPRVA